MPIRTINLLLVLFLFVFIFSMQVFAAPCYGPTMPEKNHWFSGVENYTITRSYLASAGGKIKSTQNFLLLSYGIFNWLSFDLKGGEGNIKNSPDNGRDVDYAAGFAGGYGLRVKFYDNDGLAAVLGFQHISVHPYSSVYGGVKERGILDDWQASILAGYRFKYFTPYGGVRWSRADYIHFIEDSRKRQMAAVNRRICPFAGVDIFLNPRLWLNVEGQFINAQALTCGIHCAF